MRRLLWLGSIVATATAACVAGAVRATWRASTHDTEELIWPDVRERQIVHLQTLSARLRSYAGAHHGALPSNLTALTNSLPGVERRLVTWLVVDLWSTPVAYEPTGAAFTLRSAGPDRAWNTGGDLAETAEWPYTAWRRPSRDAVPRSTDTLRARVYKVRPGAPPA
jgi:hypothetical protein